MSQYDYVKNQIWISKKSYYPEQQSPVIGTSPHDRVECACRQLIQANYEILDYIKKRNEEHNKERADMQKELSVLVPKKGKNDVENLRIYELVNTTFPVQTGLPESHIKKLNEAILMLTKLINQDYEKNEKSAQ